MTYHLVVVYACVLLLSNPSKILDDSVLSERTLTPRKFVKQLVNSLHKFPVTYSTSFANVWQPPITERRKVTSPEQALP